MTSFKGFSQKAMFIGVLSIVMAIVLFSCTPPVADDTNGDGGTVADTTAPTIAITSPLGTIIIDSNNYIVRGSASDGGGLKAIYIKVNTGAFASLGAVSPWSSNCLLVEGDNTISVYAEDNANNISTTNSVVITVNTGAPVINIELPANFFITNGTPIMVSGKVTITNVVGKLITNIEASVNGGAYSSITNGGSNYVEWSTNITALTNGTNSIAVRAYADNGKGGTDNFLYVIYDTNAPVLANITPTNNQTNICYTYPPSYILQGDVSDDLSGVAKVYVQLDTNSFTEVLVSGGSWSTNFTGLFFGTHTNWVYTVDNAGNSSDTNEIAIALISKKIVSYDGVAWGMFGYSVAISADGNTVIVATITDNSYRGAAYWLRTSDGGTNWATNKLIAYDGAASDYFGVSVAMSGDGKTVIVGANGDDSCQGSAYWLHTSDGGTTWTTSKLFAYDPAINDEFGYSVAISADGNTVIVGAYQDDIGANANQGSAYWFHTSDNGTNWATNMLIADDGVAGDLFGYSVAMSGDGNTVIVGAMCDDSSKGSAYWFRSSDGGSTWAANKLIAFDGANSDRFGNSVAISDNGNTVIVGAHYDDYNGADSGSAYWLCTFDSGTNWMTNKLNAYDASGNDRFGYSVAMSDDGNTVIVGTHLDDIGANSDQGSAYCLCTADNGSTWETNKIIAYDGANNDEFGGSVAISGDGNSWIVSSHLDNIGANDDQGSAYWWGD